MSSVAPRGGCGFRDVTDEVEEPSACSDEGYVDSLKPFVIISDVALHSLRLNSLLTFGSTPADFQLRETLTTEGNAEWQRLTAEDRLLKVKANSCRCEAPDRNFSSKQTPPLV